MILKFINLSLKEEQYKVEINIFYYLIVYKLIK